MEAFDRPSFRRLVYFGSSALKRGGVCLFPPSFLWLKPDFQYSYITYKDIKREK